MTKAKINAELVIDLYKNHNLSMQQIADKHKVSSSVVRDCLNRNGIKRRTISEAIFDLNQTKYGKRIFKLKENLTPKEKGLLIAGVMLYWGEGTKGGNGVKFANSNPLMVRVFLKFLRTICGIFEGRLKALLHLYPDHDEESLLKFWSKVTGIPRSNFSKSFVHKGKSGTYKKKSLYGTLAISYSDKKLLGIILNWIEEFQREFI